MDGWMDGWMMMMMDAVNVHECKYLRRSKKGS